MRLRHEWLNRPREVDLRESASLHPQLDFGRLVGWLTLRERAVLKIWDVPTYEIMCTQLVEKVYNIKYGVCEKHTALL